MDILRMIWKGRGVRYVEEDMRKKRRKGIWGG